MLVFKAMRTRLVIRAGDSPSVRDRSLVTRVLRASLRRECAQYAQTFWAPARSRIVVRASLRVVRTKSSSTAVRPSGPWRL